jgi:hypothetical protein
LVAVETHYLGIEIMEIGVALWRLGHYGKKEIVYVEVVVFHFSSMLITLT